MQVKKTPSPTHSPRPSKRRKVTFGEGACRVRTGQAPHNLALVRNLTITLLNRIGCKNKAAALPRPAANSHEAPAPLRGSPGQEN